MFTGVAMMSTKAFVVYSEAAMTSKNKNSYKNLVKP